MNSLRISLLLAASLACNIATAASVQDIRPQDLAAFLAKHDTVVVQFTSPDPKCRYCTDAAPAYARAVAPSRDPGIRFVRVQWPVWHKFPDFGTLEKPLGLPEQMVYRRSEVIGSVSGMPAYSTAFLAEIQRIRDNPMKTADRHRAWQQTGHTRALAMSAEEEALSRLMIRKDVVGEIIAACSSRFPESAPELQRAYASWVQVQKPELDRAAVVVMTRNSSTDAQVMNAFVRTETWKLQDWSAKDLQIPKEGAAKAESCLKIARSLDSLPGAGTSPR